MRARLQSWLAALIRRSRIESEMDEELRFHLEARADDLARAGVPLDVDTVRKWLREAAELLPPK